VRGPSRDAPQPRAVSSTRSLDLDVSGGFATPVAAELTVGADLIVGWGCSLNMWTLRHGSLVGPGATVAQVDLEPEASATHQAIRWRMVGDVDEWPVRSSERLAARRRNTGLRTGRATRQRVSMA